jgi:hypothetical protein
MKVLKLASVAVDPLTEVALIVGVSFLNIRDFSSV